MQHLTFIATLIVLAGGERPPTGEQSGRESTDKKGADPKIVFTLGKKKGLIDTLAFSKDGKYLAAGGGTDNGVVTLWDLGSKSVAATFDAETNYGVGGVAISADSKSVIACNSEGTIFVWDVATGKTKLKVSLTTRGVALASDGQTCVAGDSVTGDIVFLDITTGKEKSRNKGHVGLVRTIAAAANSPVVASGGQDETVRIWDLKGEKKPVVLRPGVGQIARVVLSPDGKKVAISGQGKAGLWDVATGRKLGDGFSEDFAFSPSGKSWVSAGDRLILCNGETGEEIGRVKHPSGGSVGGAIAFSSDGKRMATAHGTRIDIWDVSGWAK